MQTQNQGAPRGAGARGHKAPILRLGNGYVAIGYDYKSRHKYKPMGLQGYEDEIEKLFEVANYLMGVDDVIHTIVIIGETPEGEKYQVTIRWSP